MVVFEQPVAHSTATVHQVVVEVVPYEELVAYLSWPVLSNSYCGEILTQRFTSSGSAHG